MKKALVLLSALALVFCIYFVSAKEHPGRQSFSVSENDETYKIAASFNKKKNKDVQEVLHSFIKPNNIFDSGNVTYDGSITLSDKTSFDIKFLPGELKIKLDKTKNSTASYKKIKKLGEELGEVFK